MLRRNFLIAFTLLFGLLAPVHAQAQFRSDRISVTTTGSGPDVVLIPGLGSSPRVWEGLVQALPGYRYHLVQVKGFAGAPSEGNAGDGPVAAPVAEEVARYIGEAIRGPAAIVGHSMGGSIGMMIAARHPERVSRLMIVDMFPFVGAMFMPNATVESVRPIGAQIRGSIESSSEEAYRQQVTGTIASMVATESMRERAFQDSVTSDRNVSARAFEELIVTDLRPELRNIRVPTRVLYVTPRGAPLTDAQLDEYYRLSYANLSGVQLQRVAGSAHFIMYDQPELFVQEVRNFLSAIPGRGERG